MSEPRQRLPDVAGGLHRRDHQPAGPGPVRRPHRDTSASASSPTGSSRCASRPRAKRACSTPSWSRWPTTGSPRPPSRPGSRGSAPPTSIQGALAAGLLGGGSRFLGVSEDTGRFLNEALDTVEGDLPTDDAGWDHLATKAIEQRRAAGGFVPGLGHHLHKNGDPRVPRLLELARGTRHLRPAACALRGRRPRRSRGTGQDPAAQRCRLPAAPSWPTSASRSRCCAASCSSPAAPASSASSPRRCEPRLRPNLQPRRVQRSVHSAAYIGPRARRRARSEPEVLARRSRGLRGGGCSG